MNQVSKIICISSQKMSRIFLILVLWMKLNSYPSLMHFYLCSFITSLRNSVSHIINHLQMQSLDGLNLLCITNNVLQQAGGNVVSKWMGSCIHEKYDDKNRIFFFQLIRVDKLFYNHISGATREGSIREMTCSHSIYFKTNAFLLNLTF